MPSVITHELIAKSAAALLTSEERQAVAAAPDYYYLGAQGPDLYFFYKPTEGLKNWGRDLHRGTVYRWFSALLSALSSRSGAERGKCLAYALGFCTHLEADGAFHPFVYKYLKENNLKKKEHQRMENDWDVYFAAELEQKDARGYNFPFDLKKIAREGVLFGYLRDAADAFGKKIKKSAFNRMLRIFGWYCKHFHRRHFRYLLPILPALYPRATPDPAILRGEEFTRLSGAESADALFLTAAQHASERVKEFLRSVDGEPLPAAFSRHLLTGEAVEVGA